MAASENIQLFQFIQVSRRAVNSCIRKAILFILRLLINAFWIIPPVMIHLEPHTEQKKSKFY